MTLPQQQRNDLEAIVGRWREALAAWQLTGSDRDRDAAILRFKLGYEVAWKHLQWLTREEGLESNGPRQAFENAFRLVWIDDEVLWNDAIKARNLAIHVYRETLALELAAELPRLHAGFEGLITRLPPPKYGSLLDADLKVGLDLRASRPRAAGAHLSLNRMEYYPNGERKRDDVPDLSNNVRVDDSIFGADYTV